MHRGLEKGLALAFFSSLPLHVTASTRRHSHTHTCQCAWESPAIKPVVDSLLPLRAATVVEAGVCLPGTCVDGLCTLCNTVLCHKSHDEMAAPHSQPASHIPLTLPMGLTWFMFALSKPGDKWVFLEKECLGDWSGGSVHGAVRFLFLPASPRCLCFCCNCQLRT